MHKNIDLCDGLSPEYIKEIENFIAEWNSNDQFLLVNTSGSTGRPKTIQLNKKKVRESALATGRFFNFQKGQTLLLNLSPNYIAGKLMIVRALIHDMRILVAPLNQNPLLAIPHQNIHFAAFVPYQIQAIIENSSTREVYQQIPNVIIGGAPLSLVLKERLSSLSNQTFATFGMTETITHFALQNISKREGFYTTLPGFEVSTDPRGCLIIEENKITDELITNDLVEIIDRHHFIWKGRLDFVINSGGVKVSPELVEAKIESVLVNRTYFVHGEVSEVLGQKVVLYIEGDPESNLDSLIARMNTSLGSYERPKAIKFIPQFDRTETGKVIRKTYE